MCKLADSSSSSSYSTPSTSFSSATSQSSESVTMPDDKPQATKEPLAKEGVQTNQASVHAVFFPQTYNPNVDWADWLELLELYFLSKGIKDEPTMKYVLLQSIGMDIFSRLRKWVSPSQPKEKTYADLIKLLGTKYSKTSNKYSARVRLFNEKQIDGQSEREFIAHMTEIAGDCEFDKMANPHEENTVLAILRGLKDPSLREYLMTPNHDISTVDKLQALAVQFAINRKSARDICAQDSAKAPGIFKVESFQEPCKQCGNRKHFKAVCPAVNAECRKCKKTGHFEKVCRGKPDKKLALMDESSDDDYVGVLSLNYECDVPALVKQVYINDKLLDMVVDTGAACTVIPKDVWKQIGRPLLNHDTGKLRGYGSWIPVLGSCNVTVRVDAQVCETQVKVVNKGVLVLGRDWIKLFKIQVDSLINGNKDKARVESELNELIGLLRDNQKRLEHVEQVVTSLNVNQLRELKEVSVEPLRIDLEEEEAKKSAIKKSEDRVRLSAKSMGSIMGRLSRKREKLLSGNQVKNKVEDLFVAVDSCPSLGTSTNGKSKMSVVKGEDRKSVV